MQINGDVYKVIDLQNAGHLLVEDGNHGEYRPRQEEFTTQGVAFIRAADMSNSRILFDTASRINSTALSRIRKGIGAPGDILLSHKGTIGKIALAPQDSPPFVCSPQTTFWRVLNDKFLDRQYLYYFMKSEAFGRQLAAYAGETDMAPYVSLTNQRNFEIQVPPLPEQRAIAHILGSLDDKIELNRQMNATLEAIARALFQSWFVDFDPVHAKANGQPPVGMDAETAALFPASFEETEIGLVPSGWEIKPLDKVATFLNGLALQNYPPQDQNALPVIKIRELRQGFSDSNSDQATWNIPTPYVLDDGDVLFSWSGSLLVDLWCGGRGALNQHLFKVSSSDYPKWFYYQWTKHYLEEFQRIAADKATTMGHIQRKHLSSASTLIPANTSGLLERLDQMISPLLEKTIQTRLESHTLAELRDTLLPKLMSGQLRVPEAAEIKETIL